MNRYMKTTLYVTVFCLALVGLVTIGVAVTTYSSYSERKDDRVSELLLGCPSEDRLLNGVTSDIHVEKDAVTKWSDATTASIMNFNASNYVDFLQAKRHYFSPEGWCDFIHALSESRMIDFIVENKVGVELFVHKSAQFIHVEKRKNALAWKVSMPVTLRFSGVSKLKALPRPVNADLDIVYQLNEEGKLVIVQWLLIPKS